MKALVVDQDELYRCEGNATAVVVFYTWGYGVVTRRGMHEYCQDLEELLANPDVSERRLGAVRRWLDRQGNGLPADEAGTYGQ